MGPLGTLLVLFIVMAVLGILGAVLLFVIKKPSIYRIIFLAMAVLGIAIAFLNATSLPSNYLLQQIVAYFWGVLAIVALLLEFVFKKAPVMARILVCASVLVGLCDLFFF